MQGEKGEGKRKKKEGRREMTPEKQGSSSESVFLSGSPLSASLVYCSQSIFL